MHKHLLILLLATGLTGCGTFADPTTWWGDDTGPQPAELQDIKQTVTVTTLWKNDTGKGDRAKTLGLGPLVGADRVFLADADGTVLALNKADGKPAWKIELKDTAISGGPGFGEGLVLLGTAKGEVIALDAADGTERWRTQLSSEVLSAPVADLGTVVARTGDGKLFGLDTAGGNQRWRLDRDIPVLTLRGNAAPVLSQGHVLVGLEAGRLVSLDLDSGQVVWESVVSVPSGRTELERIADIDGAPMVLDRTVYVATYQGEVAALSEATGRSLWQRKMSAYTGVAVDWRRVFVSDDSGTLWALDADTGEVQWSQKSLAWRGLSAPAVIGGQVVVGDFEGYIHFFDADTGTPTGRVRVGGAPIVAAPVVRDGRLYILGSEGDFAVMTLTGTKAP